MNQADMFQLDTRTSEDATKAIRHNLRHFIMPNELHALRSNMRGEEGQFFVDMICKLSQQIDDMPGVHGQDAKGDDAIVHLHYFTGGCDWHITEKDDSAEQHQAFGMANIGYGGELGYISIEELIENNVELDLYWTPVTLREVKKEHK